TVSRSVSAIRATPRVARADVPAAWFIRVLSGEDGAENRVSDRNFVVHRARLRRIGFGTGGAGLRLIDPMSRGGHRAQGTRERGPETRRHNSAERHARG